MALDRIEALEIAAEARTVRMGEMQQQITEQLGLIKAQGAALEKLTGIVINEHHDAIENIAGIVTANAEKTVEANRILADRIEAVATQNRENAAAVVVDLENHRIETATLVSRLRDPLPKSLMIDQAGTLVAIDHAGDTREIGRVVGEPGRDAPRIEAATWKAGHVVISMSDRTSHLIELPAPAPVAAIEPAPALPGRTPEGDGIKAAVRMGIVMEAATAGKSVKSIATIAKRYNLPPLTVRAIIKDHENEAKMRGTGPTH